MIMFSKIRDFVAPRNDPDEDRRRNLVRILSMGILVLSMLVLLVVIAYVLFIDPKSIQERDNQLTLASAAAAFVFSIFIFQINKRSSRVSSFLLIALLVAVSVFSDTPEQLANGRSLFVFMIPIAVSSLIIASGSSFFFAVVNTIIVILLARTANTEPNAVAIIGFFLLAFISWLSSRNLEQALKALRNINANLDKVVIERTQALAESLEREKVEAGRNQAILNSIADGVIVFDRKWNATMANPAIRGMLEIPLELINGKNFRELIEHPKLQPKSRGLLYAMMEHETQPVGFRIEWSGKTLSVSAAQVYNTRNENIGMVTVFRDFTREAEVEKLKSTFVAIVSHELRTPLNAILGYAEMFKESIYGPMNEKQVNMADRIMKNTQRLLGLINDLLDQAQMEAGKLTIKMAPLHPAELLESLHSVMDKTASDKGLMLTSEIEDSLPETLNGDAARLQQILVNLVNNAVKFTDKGSVHVRLLYPSKNRWGFEVTDTGRGIPETELPHIFETFRQVEGTTTRVHGGFGLGLSIVKQLVHLMNGDINVQSQLDAGTTFNITLPLIVSESAEKDWTIS
jgi:PAS domain S-box-containing protein